MLFKFFYLLFIIMLLYICIDKFILLYQAETQDWGGAYKYMYFPHTHIIHNYH